MGIKSQLLKDSRSFAFGEIYHIKDELLGFPDADSEMLRTTHVFRKLHRTRPVIIAQNCAANNDSEDFVIQVIPVSSKVLYKRQYDIELNPQKDGIVEESIALCTLLQPVLKIDLSEHINDISDESKDKILATLVTRLGMDLEDYEDVD